MSPLIILEAAPPTAAIYKNYDKIVPCSKWHECRIPQDHRTTDLINTKERTIMGPRFLTLNSQIVYKYADYWFVVFRHNWLEPVSQNALTDTYRELIATEYLVVINKKTGKIPFLANGIPNVRMILTGSLTSTPITEKTP